MYKKTKYIIFFILFILLTSPILNVYAANKSDPKLNYSFLDIKKNSEYYEDISFVYGYGILEGTKLKTGKIVFFPKQKVNRELVALTLYRIAGCPNINENYELGVIDLKNVNNQKKRAIKWCHQNGIMMGTSENTFSPKNNVTVEQFATALYKYSKNYLNADIVDTEIPKYIKDSKKVSSYAKKSIAWAINEEILKPDNKHIYPKSEITKEKFAQLIRLFMNNTNTQISAWAKGFDRSLYSDLSDEEYANFRMVNVTGIRDNILYRGHSPINNCNNDDRADYCAQQLTNKNIRVIIDLADSERSALERDKFSNLKKYCPNAKVSYCYMTDITGYMLTGDEIPETYLQQVRNGLKKGLKYMSENEGPYFIHCTIGQDRTGLTLIILESLMGARIDEIEKDYLKSYENYYSIRGTDNHITLPIHEQTIHKKLMLIYERILHIEDAWNKTPDELKNATEEYLINEIKLSKNQIENIRKNLGE